MPLNQQTVVISDITGKQWVLPLDSESPPDLWQVGLTFSKIRPNGTVDSFSYKPTYHLVIEEEFARLIRFANCDDKRRKEEIASGNLPPDFNQKVVDLIDQLLNLFDVRRNDE